MLARIAVAFRAFPAVALVLVSSQCATSDSSTTDEKATAQTTTASATIATDAQPEVVIQVGEVPGNRKGLQFTLISNTDKEVQLCFPTGRNPLTLTKKVQATATFTYDTGTKKVILVTSDGTVSRGPEIVPATGSFNPIREMKPPTEKVMRPVPGWTRKLVTGENYGLQFSFMLNTRS